MILLQHLKKKEIREQSAFRKTVYLTVLMSTRLSNDQIYFTSKMSVTEDSPEIY